jgi:hypothetical protein
MNDLNNISVNKPNKESMKQLGIFYGYPECCIDSFLKVPSSERTRDQRRAHKNNGFIPCHNCSVKIINGEITLEGLITNRVCRNRFPIGRRI